jgi:alpha-L-rhamnosidase
MLIVVGEAFQSNIKQGSLTASIPAQMVVAILEKNLNQDLLTKVVSVQTQHPAGLIGTPGEQPLLTWKVETDTAGSKQQAFQIQVAADPEFRQITGDTGVVAANSQLAVASPAAAPASREKQFFRVKVETQAGWSTWSSTLCNETGLLLPEDWTAKAIGDANPKDSPSPILRRDFDLKERPLEARLYVTSMGLNDFFINGSKVGMAFLSPGWTAYQSRLLVETHDVTDLLKQGPNCLAGILSDGWWRGDFGFMGGSEHYGKEIALLAQLEIVYPDGSTETFVTDDTWRTSTAEIQFSSIYHGSTIDFNASQSGWNEAGFDDHEWTPAVIHQVDYSILKPRLTNPVVVVQQFEMVVETQEDRTLLRGPQNISGWVQLEVDGLKGQSVVVRHSEVLEPGDKLHTKALRSARATDTYILDRDGRFKLEPVFTFHGFQFADVVTDATVISAQAIAISSNNSRRGNFECSDARINRLHENVVWSQLDNFVSVPTDCPQRDERMGWTGDAQAFSNTANTLFDTASFWRSWLIDLELEQFENGDVSAVVPDILKPYPAFDGWIFEGRAGWGDAATIVPWSVYEYFGDPSVLRQQLNSMRRWVDALDKRRDGDLLLPSQFQFGDWCDPDAPGDKPWQSKVSADFVANSFFAHSASLLAAAERLVGDPERASHRDQLANDLKVATWQRYGSDARKTSTGCSILLEFAIAPASEREAIARDLSQLVDSVDGIITSGFLGTPLVLHALSKNGHIGSAYKMLMRSKFRSWLYAIEMGATTIWERWDAIGEDGTIHTGSGEQSDDESSMISFNHYAYGAVVDWMYRNLGGLAPVSSFPGFRKVLVSPKPPVGIESASVAIESAFGSISLRWQLTPNGALEGELIVPFGVEAIIQLPVSEKSLILINGAEMANGCELSAGTFAISLSHPALVSY